MSLPTNRDVNRDRIWMREMWPARIPGLVDEPQAQVLAAKVVIGKSVPDLKSIEYSGNDEKPVQRRMIVKFVEAKR